MDRGLVQGYGIGVESILDRGYSMGKVLVV